MYLPAYHLVLLLTSFLIPATISTARSPEPEYILRSFSPRRQGSAAKSSIDARSLFALYPRQRTDCPDDPSYYCTDGDLCCAGSHYCYQPGGECCASGDGTCKPGWKCCDTDGCAPTGDVCCPGRGYCPNGYICVGDMECQKVGGATDDDDYDHDDDDDDGGDTVPTPTPTPEPEPTEEIEYRDYTFTFTWYFWSYYYITQFETITLTSTEYTTSTRIIVEGTNAADARNQYESFTETMTLPGPTSLGPTFTPPEPTPEPTTTVEAPPDVGGGIINEGESSVLRVMGSSGIGVIALVAGVVVGTAGLAVML